MADWRMTDKLITEFWVCLECDGLEDGRQTVNKISGLGVSQKKNESWLSVMSNWAVH